MPTPKLKKEWMDRMDPSRRSGENYALQRAMSQMLNLPPGVEYEAVARRLKREITLHAWILSNPEGAPPYPRKGETYTAAEAVWLSSWLQDVWAPFRQLHAEGEHTADWLERHITAKQWKSGIAGVLFARGTAGEMREAFWHKANEYRPVSTTRVPIRGPNGEYQSVTLEAAGLTPKEWAERVWSFAVHHVARCALLFRAMRTPILYEKQETPEGIDAQMDAYGRLGTEYQWRAMRHFYHVHDRQDRVADPRQPQSEPDSVERLRYDHRGPPVPFSTIVALVHRAEQESVAARRADSDARDEGLRTLLHGLIRAPEGLVWNAAQAKKYMPAGFEVESQGAYDRPGEISISRTGGKRAGRVLYLSALQTPTGSFRLGSGTRQDAWNLVGALVDRARTDMEGAIRSVWTRTNPRRR